MMSDVNWAVVPVWTPDFGNEGGAARLHFQQMYHHPWRPGPKRTMCGRELKSWWEHVTLFSSTRLRSRSFCRECREFQAALESGVSGQVTMHIPDRIHQLEQRVERLSLRLTDLENKEDKR